MTTKEAIYTQDIKPLLIQITELARLHDIPFLAVCEINGLLMIQKHNLNACSELRCAYGELLGWEALPDE